MPENAISFRYRLEQATPRTGSGGITRGASVKQFPASVGIAGVSMRLAPGSMRELHWHANAAEWGLRRFRPMPHHGLASGRLVGDRHVRPRRRLVFPARLGPFHPGSRTRRVPFHTDLRQWRLFRGPHLQRHRLAFLYLAGGARADLGLSREQIAQLPSGEAYFAQGQVPDDLYPDAEPHATPALTTPHRYRLLAQQPRRVPGGGKQRTVTVDEFPILKGMAGSLLEIEPGAMRELNWHPNADEWQYYLEGTAEMAVFLAEGVVVTETFEAGDVGYAPMGAGHYIRNTGSTVLRVLVGFNNGRYEANDLSAWLAANPGRRTRDESRFAARRRDDASAPGAFHGVGRRPNLSSLAR